MGPSLLVEVEIEARDVERVDEVDERVPHIAFILHSARPYLEVDRQVEEVIHILELGVECLQQQLLVILVRYVPNHKCGPSVMPSLYLLDV